MKTPAETKAPDPTAGLLRWLIGQAGTASGPIRLPAERALAERFDLSRRQVRRAIQLLVDRKQVISRHGSGNYLCPSPSRVGCVVLIVSPRPAAASSAIVAAVVTAAAERDVQIVPGTVRSDVSGHGDAPGIVVGPIDGEDRTRLAETLAGLVVLDDDSGGDGCAVRFDGLTVGGLAVRKLAELGHRRILLLAGCGGPPWMRGVERGFIAEARLTTDFVERVDAAASWRGGYDAMRDHLTRRTGAARCTAVFAVSDLAAGGAIQATVEAGQSLRVPGDVSVLTCGETSLAEQFVPAVACFQLDPHRCARQAFAVLDHFVNCDVELPSEVILTAEFAERPSLAYAPSPAVG